MTVAASSPAWLTRRAESRNLRWVEESCSWGDGVDVGSCSVDGEAAEEVIERRTPFCRRAWS